MKGIKRILRKIAVNRARFFDLCSLVPAILIWVAGLIYYFCFSPRDMSLRAFTRIWIFFSGGGAFIGMLCYDQICKWLDKE